MHKLIKHILLHLICFITISAPQLHSNDTSPQAILKNHQETILSMIPNDTDQQEILQTKYPLHYACENNYINIVEFFLQNNVNIHSTDAEGATLLIIASHRPHIIKMLLMRGADIEACNAYDCTPLHHAAMLQSRGRATINVLLAWGASLHNLQNTIPDPCTIVHPIPPANFNQHRQRMIILMRLIALDTKDAIAFNQTNIFWQALNNADLSTEGLEMLCTHALIFSECHKAAHSLPKKLVQTYPHLQTYAAQMAIKKRLVTTAQLNHADTVFYKAHALQNTLLQIAQKNLPSNCSIQYKK